MTYKHDKDKLLFLKEKIIYIYIILFFIRELKSCVLVKKYFSSNFFLNL